MSQKVQMAEDLHTGTVLRAQGCLLGQLAGDALGSIVEFSAPGQIRSRYPHGVRDMVDGGYWETIAGQPTDDSEMALVLARSLVSRREYNQAAVQEGYRGWLNSRPFDCGGTIRKGLQGRHDAESQANGALMRVSPLGIFGALRAPEEVAEWARQDALLTHPHRMCVQANVLFTLAIGGAVRASTDGESLYSQVAGWAAGMQIEPDLLTIISKAWKSPPGDFVKNAGWVVIAFQNALWQLVHAGSLEEAVVDTIGRGGDTDTNAAVCGALLGAVYGRNAVPLRWTDAVLNCRPREGDPKVRHPRPREYWPVDALELAAALVDREDRDAAVIAPGA
jgi:ADP-ribosyl-[dinitrogen reductase] hydrolase